jgi:hypothetical protein
MQNALSAQIGCPPAFGAPTVGTTFPMKHAPARKTETAQR